jgi:hypothetical protein
MIEKALEMDRLPSVIVQSIREYLVIHPLPILSRSFLIFENVYEFHERNRSWRNLLSVSNSKTWKELRKEMMIFSLNEFCSLKFLTDETFRSHVLASMVDPYYQLGLILSQKYRLLFPSGVDIHIIRRLFSLTCLKTMFAISATIDIQHFILQPRTATSLQNAHLIKINSSISADFQSYPGILPDLSQINSCTLTPPESHFQVSLNPSKVMELRAYANDNISTFLNLRVLHLAASDYESNISLSLPLLQSLYFADTLGFHQIQKIVCPNLRRLRFMYHRGYRAKREEKLYFFSILRTLLQLKDICLEQCPIDVDDLQQLCLRCEKLYFAYCSIDRYLIENNRETKFVPIKFGDQVRSFASLFNDWDYYRFPSHSLYPFDFTTLTTNNIISGRSFKFKVQPSSLCDPYRYFFDFNFLQNYQEVVLHEIPSSYDLSPLKDVRYLTVRECHAFEDFSKLGSNHQYLAIINCIGLQTDDLVFFSSIDHLKLDSCYNVSSIVHLKRNRICVLMDLKLPSNVEVYQEDCRVFSLSLYYPIELNIHGKIDFLHVGKETIVNVSDGGSSAVVGVIVYRDYFGEDELDFL